MLQKSSARPPAFGDFRTALKVVAGFLGRPNSETVLFSGTPDENIESMQFGDVERIAERIGLAVVEYSRRDILSGNADLPAVVRLDDGEVIPLLEQTEAGLYTVSLASTSSDGQTISPTDLAARRPVKAFGFSLVYLNASEDALVGLAPEIERRHWLTSTLAPFWRTYLQVALAALFINFVALASPLFTMNVYDRVLPNAAISTLWVLAIGVGVAYLFDLILKTARSSLIDHAGRRADIRLSHLLFEKVLNATLISRPISTGEYASRVTQYEFVREFFTSNTVSLMIDTVFVFIFIFVVYLVAGWLFIIPLVAFFIAVAVGVVAQYRIGRRVAAAANESAQRHSLLVETISTIETVKSLRAEAGLLRRWQELTKHASRTSEEIKQISAGASHATQFIQQAVTVAVVVCGAYQFQAGDISTGGIIATVMLASRTVAPLGQIAMTLARFRQAMFSLRILNTIMEQPEDRPTTTGFVNRQIRSGSFSFQDISFAYPAANHMVLNKLSFSVAAGERVGIIGRIGSGKTTIGRLLGGLYPPAEGKLAIDGIDIRQYHLAEVRTHVAVAGQSADLFSGTVKENLLVGKPDATDEELLAVSRITGVDEFVARHPRGFDMPVGERGNNLSGGQKQALTIARLLLVRPRIVFLDEPSGAMDMATERMLIARLKDAFDAETTLVIATHRHSMLELIDRLIVIDQGRVVADGPKQKVIESLQRGQIANSA